MILVLSSCIPQGDRLSHDIAEESVSEIRDLEILDTTNLVLASSRRSFEESGNAVSSPILLPTTTVSYGMLHASTQMYDLQSSNSESASRRLRQLKRLQDSIYCLTDQSIELSLIYRYSPEPTSGDTGKVYYERNRGMLTDQHTGRPAFQLGKRGYSRASVDFDFQEVVWIRDIETFGMFLYTDMYIETAEAFISLDCEEFSEFGVGFAPKRSQLKRDEHYTVKISAGLERARCVRLVWHKPYTGSNHFCVTEVKIWGRPDPSQRVVFRSRSAATPEAFWLSPWSRSEWSEPFRSGEPIPSPPNRYLQYHVVIRRFSTTLSPSLSAITVDVGFYI